MNILKQLLYTIFVFDSSESFSPPQIRNTVSDCLGGNKTVMFTHRKTLTQVANKQYHTVAKKSVSDGIARSLPA